MHSYYLKQMSHSTRKEIAGVPSIFDKVFYLMSSQENCISLFQKAEEFELFQLRIGLQNLCQNTLVYPIGKDADKRMKYNVQISPHSKEFYNDVCRRFCSDSKNENKCRKMMTDIADYFCEPLSVTELELSDYEFYPYDETRPQECYIYYQCPFVHLYKCALPIYVNGIVVAVLFTGQFSLNPPTKSSFLRELTSYWSRGVPSFISHRYFDGKTNLLDFVTKDILPVVQDFSQAAQENLIKQQTALLLKRIEDQITHMEDEVTAFLVSDDDSNPVDLGNTMRQHFWELITKNLKPYLMEVGASELILFMNEPVEKQKAKCGMKLYPVFDKSNAVFNFQNISEDVHDTQYSLDETGNQVGTQLYNCLNGEDSQFSECIDIVAHLEKLQPFAIVINYAPTADISDVGVMRRKVLEHLEYYFIRVGQKLAYLSSRLSEQINKAVLRIYRHEIVHQITVLSNNNWFLDAQRLREMDEQKLRHVADDQRQCIYELDFMTQNINVVTGRIGKRQIDIDRTQIIDVNSDIINKAISLYQRAKRDKCLWFSVQNQSASGSITSNQELLDMIFFNLMGNAIKYSYPGTNIIIGFEDTSQYSRPNAITLTDFGVQVNADHQNQVFQMYFRGDSQTEGSGIGLYVANEVANILDATLSWNCVKVSNYNIPMLMRCLQLPLESHNLQTVELECLNAERKRLSQNAQLNRVFNKEYLGSPESWNSYEILEELNLPTYEVTFRLEL